MKWGNAALVVAMIGSAAAVQQALTVRDQALPPARAPGHSREQLNAAAPLGELPLAVIAVSEQPVGGELLTALQHELAELTENASFETVEGATHESLIATREYARVVARIILSVVQAASDRQRARPTG